jgi:arylsulfatase A
VYDGGVREPTLMRWPGQIPAGSVCREVAASVDLLPTLAYLSGAKLPTLPIDGYNIWPLMEGKPDSKSPHATYCLLHGPGTVRSGKWKYYPWQEGKHHEDRPAKIKNVSTQPVQLYDTVADIGETTNLAKQYPEVAKRLQTAFEKHQAELTKNRRPAATLERPPGSLSPARPR